MDPAPAPGARWRRASAQATVVALASGLLGLVSVLAGAVAGGDPPWLLWGGLALWVVAVGGNVAGLVTGWRAWRRYRLPCPWIALNALILGGGGIATAVALAASA